MSREIKFRFFPVKSGIYPRGGVMRYSDNYTSVDLAESEVWKVMQFTGLHDRNGKPIYEGDVVRTSIVFEDATLPHMGVVVYCEEYGSFGTQNEGSITLVLHHCANTREVIGNVWENPSLLKGEQP